jgi:hypothetical protein
MHFCKAVTELRLLSWKSSPHQFAFPFAAENKNNTVEQQLSFPQIKQPRKTNLGNLVSGRISRSKSESECAINGMHHPRSWVIEGSSDGDNWIIVSEERNNNDLRESDVWRSFRIGYQSCVP